MLFKGYTWDAKELFGVSLWRFLKRMHAVAGREIGTGRRMSGRRICEGTR